MEKNCFIFQDLVNLYLELPGYRREGYFDAKGFRIMAKFFGAEKSEIDNYIKGHNDIVKRQAK